ncbi:NmrA family NAD(P)-binding protein [Mycobacterium sp. 1274756.6]|uniref:NmrA family NAD(P)-binding protein n=1 Tax=Mycobacterium sp. 1274756.6 TaxID=1834076 RepID=UPI0007FFD9EF|nr:NmrA family NAD(P)-binding protein [Mycobacterium sp. 1274756.6]OBJ74289.1 nucleoside-diphosphate sugar epimerase [Mycobacterium sp. 1274756.6]
MTEPSVIAVVGATGSQGGGLAHAILDDPQRRFTLRALTRNPDSPAARELAAAGAQVVTADLDDEAGLRAAFHGAHGAYVVTNYWAPLSPEQEARRSRAEMELEHAGNAARAAAAAGVAHVVFSTLEDTRPVLDGRVPTFDGRYTVPHFDAKAEADALFVEQRVPTTFLRTAYFFDNISRGGALARGDDGTLVLTLPMGEKPLSGIAVADIGRTALGVFRRGTELTGRTVSIAGDHLTGTQYAAQLAEALGQPVAYRPIGWDEYRALGLPAAVEMGNMFQYYAEDAERFVADRDLARVRELNPGLQSFRDWLAGHAGDIPLP